jgi:3-deoxy-manno-octulosonate cytidylyltransferase (CMP-KDO synthetase)
MNLDMINTQKTVILIPARMKATRLPNKPLADIHGKPMIVHVMQQAMAAKCGDVVVAADCQEIIDTVVNFGGKAVLTNPDHPSGSDRIFEALQILDPTNEISRIINVQGDLPTLDPLLIQQANALLDDENVDIGTLTAEITRLEERDNSNVVKIIGSPIGESRLRALYFTRATAPWGEGALYHHIGLYAYRRSTLARFVTLPPSPLELREKLEQLRALEAGMRIDAAIVNTVPLGVDTPHDLTRARELIEP